MNDNAEPATVPLTEHQAISHDVAPLLVLGLPRSLTCMVGAMLGQHPQMYGLPETHLFNAEEVAEWSNLSSSATFNMAHGLLRAVAELCFGEQTEATIKLADAWLRRRSHFTTGFLFEVLAEKVYPRILVEKSPSLIFSQESLQRVLNMFPLCRFIHVMEHPRGFCESVTEAIDKAGLYGPVPEWLLSLTTFRDESDNEGASSANAPPDPQRGWYTLNRTIAQFLELVPENQKLHLRGEDVLADPDGELRRVAAWMGLRDDDEAVEEMKHPERSPYACFGPTNARYGNDAQFLESPALRPRLAGKAAMNLEGPLSWRADGAEFLPNVKLLARSFGYQ